MEETHTDEVVRAIVVQEHQDGHDQDGTQSPNNHRPPLQRPVLSAVSDICQQETFREEKPNTGYQSGKKKAKHPSMTIECSLSIMDKWALDKTHERK